MDCTSWTNLRDMVSPLASQCKTLSFGADFGGVEPEYIFCPM